MTIWLLSGRRAGARVLPPPTASRCCDKAPAIRELSRNPWPVSRVSRSSPIRARRKVAIIALPPREAVPGEEFVAGYQAGELVYPGGDGGGDQRRPHPRGVDLLITRGRCRSAAPCLESRKMFSMLVRCRYHCSHATALAGVETSMLVQMKLPCPFPAGPLFSRLLTPRLPGQERAGTAAGSGHRARSARSLSR